MEPVGYSPIVQMSDSFAVAYRRACAEKAPGGPEMIGSQLAIACADVLSVDGAGLSLFSPHFIRTPIGASDPLATAAERLQFTVGEGPCLAAQSQQNPVRAADVELAQRWPTFHRELVTKTPYRGIISLPLQGSLLGHAAIDLYFRHSERVLDPTSRQTTAAADIVTGILETHLRAIPLGSTAVDDWIQAAQTNDRAMISIAIGMITAAEDVNFTDALALLRAHAYTTGLSLDQLCVDLVTGRTTSSDLQLDAR